MSCHNCQNSKMLEQPIDCDDYSIFGYCNKNKVIHPPLYICQRELANIKSLKTLLKIKRRLP